VLSVRKAASLRPSSAPDLGGIFDYSGAVEAFVVNAEQIIGAIKLFRIDHPLDPENKYLTHACVESPDLKTFYDGIVEVDGKGEAAVDLPDWFESLNKDFRYQLTCIGGSAAVYIAEEVKDNRFRIAGGAPRMRVSWQVTGVRRDPVAQATPVTVEEDKPDDEKGYYQNPEAYGQAPEKGVRWMRGAERRRRREAVESKRRRGEDQARSRG
jgi:trimeric autotransporter adhesin